MKTTIELPDELFREIKVRAAREGRSMKDLLTDILRNALAGTTSFKNQKPSAKLPILKCKSAKPGEEMTPDRIAEVLWGSAE